MIARLTGKIFQKQSHSVILEVQGIYYELIVPSSVVNRLDEIQDASGCVTLITHHYIQIDPSKGTPVLVGFLNEIEKDFFQQFIKVSGIGPRAAVRALDKPISEIVRAIDEGNIQYLKTLPGIGAQRAKEIVAKLQGKVGKFGLIKDSSKDVRVKEQDAGFQQEVLLVLQQLQYKKQEAMEMIEKALERAKGVDNAEDLLNEIYKQRVHEHG